MEISKELLSAVLEENVLSIRPYISNDPFYKDVIMWECRKDTYDIINIYYLIHKCKEWACKKGFIIIEYPLVVQVRSEKEKELLTTKSDKTTNLFHPLRVFKACEWVLKEI